MARRVGGSGLIGSAAALLIAAAPALGGSGTAAFATTGTAPPPPSWPAPVLTDPAPDGFRVAEAGVLGNYFRSAGSGRRPGLLLLGGSEGGLGPGAARQARDLAAHGFNVLELAYFGGPGLPPQLSEVPLETFDRGLAWLRRRPEVDPQRLGVVGGSKGAEAALLVASHDPAIRAVVVGMPSSVVWPGIGSAGPQATSWTRDGRPAPFLPFAAAAGSRIFELYAQSLPTLAQHPQARIPVETIRAPMLLVCGRADALWPSCAMAEQVQAARAARGLAAKVLAYDGAGHAVFGPPVAPGSPAYPTLGSLGGDPQGNNAARTDGWPRVIGFLRDALGE